MLFSSNPNGLLKYKGMNDLMADTTSDLVTEIEGKPVIPGAICLVISTGEFYVFGSDQAWHNVTDPEGEDNPSLNTTSLSSTRSITPLTSSLNSINTIVEEDENFIEEEPKEDEIIAEER